MTGLSRPARRLIVAVLALLAVDVVEPGVLRRLEEARYEDRARDFRFENSDLFGVGPLVDYLRDHPAGRQPRVMFLGNSVTYGYGLSPAEALPAQYQRLDDRERVLNVGVNFFDLTSVYLVAKATLGAVDHAYVLTRTDMVPEPLISRRIPVTDDDVRRFGLPVLDPIETALENVGGRWALYRDSYRLQTALFGTSSRQYLYLNKGRFARGLVSVVRAQAAPAPAPGEVTALTPLATAMPGADRLARLRQDAPELMWELAERFQRGGKRIAFLQVAFFPAWLRDTAAIADFNRAFFPHARVILLDLPEPMLIDGMHLNTEGAASAARALWRERQAFEAHGR